jgi:hypothetical protein
MDRHAETKAVIAALRAHIEGRPIQQGRRYDLTICIVAAVASAVFAVCIWLLTKGRLFVIPMVISLYP